MNLYNELYIIFNIINNTILGTFNQIAIPYILIKSAKVLHNSILHSVVRIHSLLRQQPARLCNGIIGYV